MWDSIREHSWAIGISLVLHAVVVGLMLFSLDTPSKSAKTVAAKVDPIKAVAVSESRIKDEMKKLRREEARKKWLEKQRKKKLEEAAKKARRERLREQKRLADLKKKRAREEKQRKEQLKKRKLAQKKEQQRIAALKKKQAEEKKALERIRQEKIRLEKKRKEQARKAAEAEKQRKLAEKKRQEEKRRKEEAARKAALKKQMEAEEAAERKRELATLLDKYKAAIRAKVQRNWRRPAGVKKGDFCEVLVTQAPGGFVLSAVASQCTASGQFRRSVETAVLKADPLPKPPDKALFDRQIRFRFFVED